ncbi:hypothetical protein QQF64_012672 [Cirrhinus molitorella]|uniref:Uncharacterized protein n=1 Tax=Cirrhinus molitorella TaxID=172907 RepID=A0ABR3LZS4_9TELE
MQFSDRTEKRFIVQQCDSRVSKDQRRIGGRRERLQYRLQAENQSALFPPSLREIQRRTRPGRLAALQYHTQTFIHMCNASAHQATRVWPQYKSKPLATLD